MTYGWFRRIAHVATGVMCVIGEVKACSMMLGEGGHADLRCCGVNVFFYWGDEVNKISICGVAVISNPSVCDVCVFYAAVFGEMKLFAVLWFLVWYF